MEESKCCARNDFPLSIKLCVIILAVRKQAHCFTDHAIRIDDNNVIVMNAPCPFAYDSGEVGSIVTAQKVIHNVKIVFFLRYRKKIVRSLQSLHTVSSHKCDVPLKTPRRNTSIRVYYI